MQKQTNLKKKKSRHFVVFVITILFITIAMVTIVSTAADPRGYRNTGFTQWPLSSCKNPLPVKTAEAKLGRKTGFLTSGGHSEFLARSRNCPVAFSVWKVASLLFTRFLPVAAKERILILKNNNWNNFKPDQQRRCLSFRFVMPLK